MFGALPLGILIGFLIVRTFEHHQEDRKIWYAVLFGRRCYKLLYCQQAL